MSANANNNRKLNGYEARKVRAVLDELLSSEAVSRHIEMLVMQANKPDTSAFARYAGMVLRDAGGKALQASPQSSTLRLRHPGNGKLVRITCPKGVERQLGAIPTIENAINRLVGIGLAIEDGRTGTVESGPNGNAVDHGAVNVIGTRGLAQASDHRYAHVLLPRTDALGHATPAYFNELDWRCIDNVASNAQSVFSSSYYSNDRLSLLGAQGKAGGDWDMRTRLAWILENLELPFRFTYRFDCDAQAKTACVRFVAPGAASFPSLALDDATGRLEPIGALAGEAARAYALRLGALVAAACFGSGKKVEHALVIAEGDDIEPFACLFERAHFAKRTLTALATGALTHPDLRFAPDLVGKALQTERLEFGDVRAELVLGLLPNRQIEPWEDLRALPAPLEQLFRARRVCDIDAQRYHGGNEAVIDEAKADSADSMMAAIAYLENIVESETHKLAAPDSCPDTRPLFCDHAASRLAVALLDDEVSVGSQAESFLNTGEDGLAAVDDSLRFFRAPDALFHAHVGLSDLYQRSDDMQAAERQADRCIALGPTCAISYLRKADALAGQKRFAQAANVLIGGLRCAIDEGDCAVLYHELALLFWRMRKGRESAACHVYAASLSGPYAVKAAATARRLRANDATASLVPASAHEAALAIAKLGIPVVPGKAAHALIARAAIGLADAGAPRAAAPYAALLSRHYKNDRVTLAAFRSIQFGIGER